MLVIAENDASCEIQQMSVNGKPCKFTVAKGGEFSQRVQSAVVELTSDVLSSDLNGCSLEVDLVHADVESILLPIRLED